MDELKPCPLCGSSCFALIIDGVELGSCSKEGCALWDNMISIKVWQTRPIEDRLRAEIEHLKAYCDKLAAGYPDGMLPTDIQVIKDANWTFAQQVFEKDAEIERLRKELKAAENWIAFQKREYAEWKGTVNDE